MIIPYNGIHPSIGRDVFIAPTAVVLGKVSIGDGASIWYNVVLRGDMDTIAVGRNTNIQDNCTVHTDFGFPAVIGDNVSVGHNAVVHGCTVQDGALIAINAVVLNGAHVGEGAVVAAGSVVTEGQQIEPYHLAVGAPAVMKKKLSPEALKRFRRPVKNYLELSRRHRALNLSDPD